MSSNWKKDLDDSLRIVKNGFMTGDIHTEFRFSSEQGDPSAEVKNALKKRRLYLLAFAFFPAFSGIIGGAEEVFFRLLHINPYGAVPMMIRYASAFLGTVVAIRFIKNWRGLNRDAKAAYDENIMARAVQEVMPGAAFGRMTVWTVRIFICAAWFRILTIFRGAT